MNKNLVIDTLAGIALGILGITLFYFLITVPQLLTEILEALKGGYCV